MTAVSPPPKDKRDKFRDRKWKESLTRIATSSASGLETKSFVVAQSDSGLNAERVLTGSSNVSVTDNGANSSIVIDLTASGVAAGTYDFATITVDAKGRVTAAISGEVDLTDYVPYTGATDDVDLGTHDIKASGIKLAIATETSSYLLDASDCVILADATSGDITITLPTAASAEGRHYAISKTDSSANTVTIEPDGSEEIVGESSLIIEFQYSTAQITSDGIGWVVI